MRISDWSSDVCSSDLSGAETVTTDKTTQPVTRTVASSLEQIPSLLVPRLRIYAALLHSNFSQSFPNLSSCGSMRRDLRSEEHTSELQSLMRISYAVFCLKKTKQKRNISIRTQK